MFTSMRALVRAAPRTLHTAARPALPSCPSGLAQGARHLYHSAPLPPSKRCPPLPIIQPASARFFSSLRAGTAREGVHGIPCPKGVAAKRLLCSAPAEHLNRVKAAWTWISNNRTAVAFVTMSLLVMYGFYRISIRLMKFFLNVPPNQIFMAGVLSGAVAAGVGFLLLIFGRRYMRTHPDGVYRAAVAELRKNPKVDEMLGGFWRPGRFQGHAIESFEEAVAGSDRRARTSYFQAPSPRVQMIFELKGATRDGLVSLESYKRGGSYTFEMLALDVMGEGGKPNEHLLVAGVVDRPLFKDIARVLGMAKAGTSPS